MFSSGEAPSPSPGTAGTWQLRLAGPPGSGSVRLSNPPGTLQGALDPGRGFLGARRRGVRSTGSAQLKVQVSGKEAEGVRAPVHSVGVLGSVRYPRAESSDTRCQRLGTSPQPWTRMAGRERPAQVHSIRVVRSGVPATTPRTAALEASGGGCPGPGPAGRVGTPARSRGGRSPAGKSSRFRTRLARQNGADLGAAADSQLRAALHFLLFPWLHAARSAPRRRRRPRRCHPGRPPTRSCGPSSAELGQRRPAPQSQQARPRPRGAESPEAPPTVRTRAGGGALSRCPPSARAVRGQEPMEEREEGGALRDADSTLERAGPTGSSAAGGRAVQGWGRLKSRAGGKVTWGPERRAR